MPKCSRCGLTGSFNDESKFIRHGYPSEGSIRISCKFCGSGTMKNTFRDTVLVYLEYFLIFGFVAAIVIIFFLSLIYLAVNGITGS